MRRVAIVAIAAAGAGLFGTGVHGLTKVDGQLAGAADPPRTHQIKLKHAPPADCPWRERRDDRRL